MNLSSFNLAPKFLRTHFGPEGQDVFDFHKKFLVPMSPTPALLDKEAAEFRIKFMQEELNEFVEACNEGNLLKAADALVDLVYVALGTALMMGLPWRSLWNRVQTANMLKRRAKDDGSDSKRGSPLDVVKPEGWEAPDHAPILGDGNWPIFNMSGVSNAVANYLKTTAGHDGPGGLQQGVVTHTMVQTDADGHKHHTSFAEPADFRMKT